MSLRKRGGTGSAPGPRTLRRGSAAMHLSFSATGQINYRVHGVHVRLGGALGLANGPAGERPTVCTTPRWRGADSERSVPRDNQKFRQRPARLAVSRRGGQGASQMRRYADRDRRQAPTSLFALVSLRRCGGTGRVEPNLLTRCAAGSGYASLRLGDVNNRSVSEIRHR